jgi:hypothetical protein
MVLFRRNVEKVLQTGCVQCHTVGKVEGNNRFALFAGEADQAVYSNFIILQQFERKQDGVVRKMIDRTHPEESLLSQYMLPAAQAQIPHPKVQNYAGMVKNANDPRYVQVLNWLRSLPTLAPDYGIDLMTDAGNAGGGAPAGGARKP